VKQYSLGLVHRSNFQRSMTFRKSPLLPKRSTLITIRTMDKAVSLRCVTVTCDALYLYNYDSNEVFIERVVLRIREGIGSVPDRVIPHPSKSLQDFPPSFQTNARVGLPQIRTRSLPSTFIPVHHSVNTMSLKTTNG
jgi:hypothetical protein